MADDTIQDDPEVTKVIFRRWNDDGGVIALFPEVPADIFGYEVLSYEHVGQHGPASYANVMSVSRPASMSDKDVRALFDELEGRGYRLNPVQRRTYSMDKARFAEADRLREELEAGGDGLG